MKIVETAMTAATVDRVWSILNDPRLMPSWNSRCVKCDAQSSVMDPGISFEGEFVMGNRGKVMRSRVSVVEQLAPQRLVLRYDVDGRKGEAVTETFELIDRGGCTLIRQTLDLSRAGIPWWARLVVKWVTMFGRPVAPGSVDGLKALAERT